MDVVTTMVVIKVTVTLLLGIKLKIKTIVYLYSLWGQEIVVGNVSDSFSTEVVVGVFGGYGYVIILTFHDCWWMW